MNNIMPTQTSQLVQNLTQIYNTKLQIKSVLGTNSDNFTEYPSLIEAAIEGGGGSGEGSGSNPLDFIYPEDIIENVRTGDYVRFAIDTDSGTLEDPIIVEEGGETLNYGWETLTFDYTGTLSNDDEVIFHVTADLTDYKEDYGMDFMATLVSHSEEENSLGQTLVPNILNSCMPILTNVEITPVSGSEGEYTATGDVYLMWIGGNEQIFQMPQICGGYYVIGADPSSQEPFQFDFRNRYPEDLLIVPIRQHTEEENYTVVHCRPYDSQNDTFDDSDEFSNTPELFINDPGSASYTDQIQVDLSGESGDVEVCFTTESYTWVLDPESDPSAPIGNYESNNDEVMAVGPMTLAGGNEYAFGLYIGETTWLLDDFGRVIEQG